MVDSLCAITIVVLPLSTDDCHHDCHGAALDAMPQWGGNGEECPSPALPDQSIESIFPGASKRRATCAWQLGASKRSIAANWTEHLSVVVPQQGIIR